MSVLNERIKERRLSLGLTLLEVAEYLGVKEATAQRYESGDIKNIKHETITSLADLLKCSPAYLMGWDNQIKENYSMTDIEQTHIHKYRSIDNKGRHTVDTVLDMEYNRCNKHQDQGSVSEKKKYIPTEEDIRSLVARNGKKLTREEAIEFISTMYSEDDDE